MENNNTVSVGPTTIVGWVGAFLALVPTIIKAVEEGQVALAGPEKYLAIAGIALAVITNIGRYLQAHKMIGASESNLFNEFESDATQVFEAVRPQSAVKPDGPPAAGPATVINSEPNIGTSQ